MGPFVVGLTLTVIVVVIIVLLTCLRAQTPPILLLSDGPLVVRAYANAFVASAAN